MIAYYFVRRWRSRPCPRCGKRVKRGLEDCPTCEAKLRWEGPNVFLNE